MTIDFNKHKEQLFNKSFFEVRKAKTRFLVVYGGSGSGKSVTVAQNEVINLLTTKHDTLYLRKYASDLYESAYKEVKGCYERWKLEKLFKPTYSSFKREILNVKSGKKIVFRGVDDPGKLKSIVGFKRIICEEADQLTEDDFTELTRRARGIDGIQIVLVFNPINENHWIKRILFDNENYRKKTTILHYTYEHNKFLKEEDIESLLLLKEVNPYEYEVYVLGKWGVIRPKSPYFYNFSYSKHVKKDLQWNENLSIVLSFDFNVVNSCLAGQVSIYDRYVRFLKEWQVEGLDLEDLCEDIIDFFGTDVEYIITGDATGNNGSALSKGNASGYDIIKKKFREFGIEPIFQVPNTNARLIHSKNVCNAILKREENVLIDESCSKTISDVQRMKLATDGSLDKKDAEKNNYGHLGDCKRYILTNLCLELYNSYGIFTKKNSHAEYNEDLEENFFN